MLEVADGRLLLADPLDDFIEAFEPVLESLHEQVRPFDLVLMLQLLLVAHLSRVFAPRVVEYEFTNCLHAFDHFCLFLLLLVLVLNERRPGIPHQEPCLLLLIGFDPVGAQIVHSLLSETDTLGVEGQLLLANVNHAIYLLIQAEHLVLKLHPHRVLLHADLIKHLLGEHVRNKVLLFRFAVSLVVLPPWAA